MRKINKDGEKIILGELYLFNNLWGKSTGEGNQEIVDKTASDRAVRWETSWDWSGDDTAIKSYSALVWGWHWGWAVRDTSLPVRFSAIKNMVTSWKYSVRHSRDCKLNVTYDMWISNASDIENENPSSEIMIWLYKSEGITPIGKLLQTVAIDDVEWDVWAGPHPVSGWPVYSFVRKANTDSVALNLVDFFAVLFGVGLRSDSYLVGVEAGAEIFVGSGTLSTTEYSLHAEITDEA